MSQSAGAVAHGSKGGRRSGEWVFLLSIPGGALHGGGGRNQNRRCGGGPGWRWAGTCGGTAFPGRAALGSVDRGAGIHAVSRTLAIAARGPGLWNFLATVLAPGHAAGSVHTGDAGGVRQFADVAGGRVPGAAVCGHPAKESFRNQSAIPVVDRWRGGLRLIHDRPWRTRGGLEQGSRAHVWLHRRRNSGAGFGLPGDSGRYTEGSDSANPAGGGRQVG